MEYLVEKVGMSRTVGETCVAVTILRLIPAKVVKVSEGRGLVAYSRGKALNKSVEGKQKAHDLSKEFNKFATLDVANTEVGDLDVTALINGKKVKASFTTKGRGFTGVIKRWNFQGGPGGHGSRFHRTGGSIGNRTWPGRVQKGKKMPGQYGNDTVTAGCDIVSFDGATGMLVLKGCVSGPNGGMGKVKVVK